MIYTRRFEENKVVLDYAGTSRDLRVDILLILKNMIERKDIEENDLATMILVIFKNLSEDSKIALSSLLIDDIKGGSLWQELEDLSKSEKK